MHPTLLILPYVTTALLGLAVGYQSRVIQRQRRRLAQADETTAKLNQLLGAQQGLLERQQLALQGGRQIVGLPTYRSN